MEFSQKGLEFTMKHEGLRLQAYRDTGGVPTVGYGHTKGVKMGDVITKEQAEQFLRDDVYQAVMYVNNLVKVHLGQNQFDALVDFVFNVGPEQFRTSTLLKLLNTGDYIAASKQFARWRYDNGKEIAGLIARRKDETELFLS